MPGPVHKGCVAARRVRTPPGSRSFTRSILFPELDDCISSRLPACSKNSQPQYLYFWELPSRLTQHRRVGDPGVALRGAGKNGLRFKATCNLSSYRRWAAHGHRRTATVRERASHREAGLEMWEAQSPAATAGRLGRPSPDGVRLPHCWGAGCNSPGSASKDSIRPMHRALPGPLPDGRGSVATENLASYRREIPGPPGPPCFFPSAPASPLRGALRDGLRFAEGKPAQPLTGRRRKSLYRHLKTPDKEVLVTHRRWKQSEIYQFLGNPIRLNNADGLSRPEVLPSGTLNSPLES